MPKAFEKKLLHVSNVSIKRQAASEKEGSYLEILSFERISKKTNAFADHIQKNLEKITNVLLEYESYEVVMDEISRSLDLLQNLQENRTYFSLRIGNIVAFLPRNQPLYAFTCFVIVPSLMATEVHFRIPHSMKKFFPQLLDILEVSDFFPNVKISKKERVEFLSEHSSLRFDPLTNRALPLTEAVIFTGASHHAEKLRLVFDKRTLFITNGAGHNPLIVSCDADMQAAVTAAVSLQFYNQGQDCAAPNAVLVHSKIFNKFAKLLREKISHLKVGPYKDRSCRIGPISDSRDLVRIQTILVDNEKWLDPNTPGVISTAQSLVMPTIINKPLQEGGNFTEVFAPILFLQKYNDDPSLSLYFEDKSYARNAMYVTLYGSSSYVESLVGKTVHGKILHDTDSILINKHLHEKGIERGTKPYGGYGIGASSLSINSKTICMPTLPQRDIYEHLAKPFLNEKERSIQQEMISRASILLPKDIKKFLAFRSIEDKEKQQISLLDSYIDLQGMKVDGKRYVKLQPENSYTLLDKPNIPYAAHLHPKDLQNIRLLREFLKIDKKISPEEFSRFLYDLPKGREEASEANHTAQANFFTHIYYLVFGKSTGPRLARFLLEVDKQKICELLDV